MILPRRTAAWVALILFSSAAPLGAQRELAGAARMKLALDKLNVLGTVLMIAAHPDDENTALLAFFARGKKLRTAYLSLTRGEGGQNLIGPEQGDLLGIIRTQELLAARRVDGAEQYFTRAIDFGFSKSAGETLAKWGREDVLGDVVWIIRQVRPDIVVLRFSGTANDGHGHHTSSALLGKEAFTVAADPARYPEQLKWVKPWQAKRLLWNAFSFRAGRFSDTPDLPDRIDVDLGQYDPVLGFSYAEIAGMGRSLHRTQGFGAAEPKGSVPNTLVVVAGDAARSDPLEGIDTTWNRVPGGAAVGAILTRAADSFKPEHPADSVRLLLEARSLLAGIHDPWADRKRTELDEAIAIGTGLWLDARADRYSVTPGSTVNIDAIAVNRSDFPLELLSVSVDGAGVAAAGKPLSHNQPAQSQLQWKVPAGLPFSQPYWLRRPKHGELYTVEDPRQVGQSENSPVLAAHFRLKAGGQEIELTRPVIYRYVDRVRGELTRALAVVPPAGIQMLRPVKLFPDDKSRQIDAQITANIAPISGTLRLKIPNGWKISPEFQSFDIADAGGQVNLRFDITPPEDPGETSLLAVAKIGEVEVASGVKVIDYPHIPPQTLSPAASERLVRAGVKTAAKSVGYVMGAGDQVPDALQELGCDVTLLTTEDLAHGDLGRYDAIVTGIRAYNVREDLRANQRRLMAYVENGGTVIVQYNVAGGQFPSNRPEPLGDLGPYPLVIGRSRVSVEEAEMRFLHPELSLLQVPNKVTPADFAGWAQERGLYFASEWDPRYTPLWETHDPGEPPLEGGTLYASYGKGAYVLTSLSWFRQLPAGVPGAFRIFANFLSAGKTGQ